MINIKLTLNKKGTKKKFSSLSQVVAGTGLEPVTLQALISRPRKV